MLRFIPIRNPKKEISFIIINLKNYQNTIFQYLGYNC